MIGAEVTSGVLNKTRFTAVLIVVLAGVGVEVCCEVVEACVVEVEPILMLPIKLDKPGVGLAWGIPRALRSSEVRLPVALG